ncbi:MAG: hypothetical protein IH852_07455 [Bacteroidetes bacterium]|nr:hypothetical protein [Bacteroidota bacterium]
MMEINCSIQIPLTYNCWKHHAGFIKNQIEIYRGEKISVEELQKTLLVIGESQMDLYVGELSPQKICNEIVSKLKSTGVFAFEAYKKWLFEKGNAYKLIEISDNSVWALRLGKQKERYIHIHPGRYSPDTLRVKALTLKTAIAMLIINYKKNFPLMDTLKINEVRKKILNSPPVKKVSSNSAVVRVINILS